jgi:hypothetical protein
MAKITKKKKKKFLNVFNIAQKNLYLVLVFFSYQIYSNFFLAFLQKKIQKYLKTFFEFITCL